jgi:hypothetical protein
VSDRIAFPEHAWPLLRKALEHIAAHPDEFYMGYWWVGLEHTNEVAEVVATTGLPFPECGTAACLAGHICLEAGVDPVSEGIGGGRALRLLGLPDLSPAGLALRDVFSMTEIASYAELRVELASRFTFPEPLPEPVAVAAMTRPDILPHGTHHRCRCAACRAARAAWVRARKERAS